MTTKLVLVTPGCTDWSAAGRIQGQLDVPLNAEGKKQIQNIISGLAKLKGIKSINSLYAGPLSRSVETAEAVGAIFKLKPNKLKELNELNCGLWQGLLETQVEKRYKKLYNIWKSNPLLAGPPKGEGVKEAGERVISAVKKLAEKFRGQVICIVCHEMAAGIIRCHYKKIDLADLWASIPRNGSVEVIEIKNG